AFRHENILELAVFYGPAGNRYLFLRNDGPVIHLLIDEHHRHTRIALVMQDGASHGRWAAQARQEARMHVEKTFARYVEKALRQKCAVIDDDRDVPLLL